MENVLELQLVEVEDETLGDDAAWTENSTFSILCNVTAAD